MKKRLLSLFLAVCLVTVLFAGTVPTAAAATADKVAGYLVSYTFQAGDTIYSVCERRNIDFATNLDKIARLNNITNYNYMMPGKVLWLPSNSATTDAPYYTLLAHTLAPGETPASLCQSYGVDYNARYNMLSALNSNVTTFMAGQLFILPLYIDPTGTAPTPPAPTATPVPTATPAPGTTPAPTATPAPVGPAGDTVAYYLAQHVLQAGETVSGVCAAMGVDFDNQSAFIQTINEIQSYNYMLPGKVLLLPVKAQPTSGSYYKIMAHVVKAGDTVYNLCVSYGLNYFTYESLIQRLNGRTNLATYYPGNTVYLPVYVSAPSGNIPIVNPTNTPGPGTVTPIPVVTATPAPIVTATPAPGVPTATPVVPAPTEDTLSYLIIPHVLQSGETVSGICAALGVDFMSNYDRIMQLSNISNYNYLMPGKVILIPSTTYPASGPYYKIMAHTLVAGDTVYGLCQRYGLDYSSNATFLQRLNNRDNLATFYVGQVVYMPLYVDAPSTVPVTASPVPIYTPTPGPVVTPVVVTPTPAPGTVTPTPAPTAAPTATPIPAVPAEDTLSYLVIVHELKSGETVSGICVDLGVDFTANADRIRQLSSIYDYNYLMPGKLILIPSNKYPSSGPYYKIMAHKLVAGDTMNGLCQSYGLDYNTNADFLKRLNNRNDLSTFYVGQTVYMPLYVAG